MNRSNLFWYHDTSPICAYGNTIIKWQIQFFQLVNHYISQSFCCKVKFLCFWLQFIPLSMTIYKRYKIFTSSFIQSLFHSGLRIWSTETFTSCAIYRWSHQKHNPVELNDFMFDMITERTYKLTDNYLHSNLNFNIHQF